MGYTSSLGLTPAFSITRGSADLTDTFSDRLVALTVSLYQGGGVGDNASIVLDDRSWDIALPNIGEDGAELAISMGYVETGLVFVGTFKVMSISLGFPPKTFTLNCTGVDLNSNLKAPLITSHDNQTLGDIVGAIAAAANVSPVVSGALSGVTIPYINQHEGSGHLLQDLESRFNALAKFGEDKLAFTERGTRQSASGQNLASITLDAADISNLQIQINTRQSYSKTRASYWDKEQHKLIWLDSSVSGDSASKVPFMLKRGYNSQTEAQAAADSQQAAMNRQGCTGNLTMSKGDPRIIGGGGLTLTGMRSGIDYTYTIDVATHSLTKDGGLSTSLQFYSEDGAGGILGADDAAATVAGDGANQDAPL